MANLTSDCVAVCVRERQLTAVDIVRLVLADWRAQPEQEEVVVAGQVGQGLPALGFAELAGTVESSCFTIGSIGMDDIERGAFNG